MRVQQHPADKTPILKGTVISPDFTVILRNRSLEFYQVQGGPWEKRAAPDFALTAEETEALFDFLLLVLPAELGKTTVFET